MEDYKSLFPAGWLQAAARSLVSYGDNVRGSKIRFYCSCYWVYEAVACNLAVACS